MKGRTVAKTVCNMCTNACGLNVHVEDDKIVEVEGMEEHPFHKVVHQASSAG